MEEKCEKCKKNRAEVEFIEVVEGKKIEKKLCKKCLEESSIAIQEYIPALVQKQETSIEHRFREEENIICPKCQLSLFEFFKRSKFGCEKCFDTFDKVLPQFFKKLHGDVLHTGKKYAGTKVANVEFKRNILKRALEEAVEKEEYERAARIRDMLRNLTELEGKSEKQ